MLCAELDDVHRAGPGQPHELVRRERGHVAVGTGADPDDLVREERPLDQDLADARQRERRNGPGRESGRLLDLVGPCDPGKAAARRLSLPPHPFLSRP